MDDRLFTNNLNWLVWDPNQTANYGNLLLSTFSDVSVASGDKIVRLHKQKTGMPLTSREVGIWDDETKEISVIPWDLRIDYQKTIVNGAIMVNLT